MMKPSELADSVSVWMVKLMGPVSVARGPLRVYVVTLRVVVVVASKVQLSAQVQSTLFWLLSPLTAMAEMTEPAVTHRVKSPPSVPPMVPLSMRAVPVPAAGQMQRVDVGVSVPVMLGVMVGMVVTVEVRVAVLVAVRVVVGVGVV